jgi:hypothetical protein
MATRRKIEQRAILAVTVCFGAAAVWAGSSAGTLRLPLSAEKLTAPAGASLPSWETLELTPKGRGRYDLRLAPGDDAPRLADVDLALLAPRASRLARGNDVLTRFALLQREYNRNEIHNPLPDGSDLSIANNCLERGLWEIKLARTEAGKTATIFHAWFTFPQEEYAALFRTVNPGLDYGAYERLFATYPGMGGFALPLEDLRRVRSERELGGLQSHGADALDRLNEQSGKVKLVRSAGIETYGDVTRAEKQPITLAKFTQPGRYDPEQSMRFDLTWLAHPAGIVWRQVESPRAQEPFPELEIRFENGFRVVAADPELARMVPRAEVPHAEADVLKFVCGIGTPVIHATAAERAVEVSTDRPRYLLIVDAKGNNVDNHLTGVDGLYAWRDAAGNIHLWLLSYERIAFVAHLSARWPGGA